MNRFNKALIIVITALLIFSLAGCGGTSGEDAPAAGDNIPAENGADNNSEAPTAEPEPEENEATFTETTIVATDDCTVIVKSYDPDDLWGPKFTFYLENNTADTTLMYSIMDASANGFMCGPLWAEKVAPGKKTNADVSWSRSSMEDNGINYLEEAEFTFRVYDSDDWGADDLFNDIVTLTVENTSGDPANEPVVYDHGFGETTLASTDAVTVIAKDFDPEALLSQQMVLYLENNSDKALMYTFDDVSVNGFMCDPFWSAKVMPGKKEYTDVSWSSSSLEENGITDIETIEGTLRIYDADDWLADDVFNEIVTINIAD